MVTRIFQRVTLLTEIEPQVSNLSTVIGYDLKTQPTLCQNLDLSIFDNSDPGIYNRPRVAKWLERPLGVLEAGVPSPTASHQRRKNGRFALLSLALGIRELGIRLAGSESVSESV